jgi:hypothetical protein
LVGERPCALLKRGLKPRLADRAFGINQRRKHDEAVPLRIDATIDFAVEGMQNRGNKVTPTVVAVGANLDDSVLNQVYLQLVCERRPNRTPEPAPRRSKTVNHDFSGFRR